MHRSVRGGNTLAGGAYGNGFFFEPTVIDEVDPASPIGQDEVFGPVIAVTPFSTLEEAVSLANGTDYGLVAGVWTRDISTAHRMIQEISAGQVFVNTYGASGGVEIPFGGMKRSGFGREKGVEGLRGFGQLKTAVVAHIKAKNTTAARRSSTTSSRCGCRLHDEKQNTLYCLNKS